MVLTSALMALTLLAQASTAPASQSSVVYKLAGKDVVLQFPQPSQASVPDDVLNWKGFEFLPAPRAAGSTAGFDVPDDWSGVKTRFEQGHAAETAGTPVWHTKFVVMTRVEILDRGADGVLRQRRATIEANQIADTLQEIARFAALVTAETGGAVKIDPDVELENELIRQDAADQPFGAKFAQDYFRARINGGKFEAEDKVYRGPYNSVFYIHPGLVPGFSGTNLVNGAPVTGISLAALSLAGTSSPSVQGALAGVLYSRWVGHVAKAAERAGWAGYVPGTPAISDRTGMLDPSAIVPAGGWPLVASLDPISPERHAANAAEQRANGEPAPGRHGTLWRAAPASPNFSLAVTSDPDRGDVLLAKEIGQLRMGGAELPERGDSKPLFSLADSPYLSFWVRSTSSEPMALQLIPAADGRGIGAAVRPRYFVAIGRDAPSFGAKRDDLSAVVETAFMPNGRWQHIVADLAPLKAAGLNEVAAITIGPSASDLVWERNQLGPIEYQFDAFQVAAQGTATPAGPLSPSFTSENEQERAMAAATSTDVAALAKALADPSDLVKLNAASSLLQHPGPSAVPALINAAHSVNSRVAEFALKALWAEGSAPAKAEVRRLLTASPFDYTRQVAATLLAETKDPNLAGPISELFGRPSWQARKAGAEAVAKLPGRDPAIILMVFLMQADPEIRLTATELADPSVDTIPRRMEWSLVNDPSDAVRVASFVKLMDTGKPALTKEALRAVRDDSVWVRTQIVGYLRAHPSEDNRAAIRQAVADSDPNVRAEALLAFAALEKPVTLEEIANVLADKNPVVQKALVDLAVKKGLTLPKATVDMMKGSPDPTVVEKAKSLPGA